MSLDKTRRGRLGLATVFAAMALFQVAISHHAQVNHTFIPHKGSWYTPEIGYVVALCFFLMAAFLVFFAFRKSDEQKQ
jgi:hypothetical protein